MVRQGKQRIVRHLLRASAVALSIVVPVGTAMAQAPAATAAPQPSTNAMVNLIQLLVKQGTITQANGDALLVQAQSDADQARANIKQASANAGLPPPPDGTVRVPYVPETVRRQIAEQVRSEVMSQAKSEGWAAPGNAAPDWTRRIKISGDIRVRSQSDLYSRKNSTDLIDISQLGAGSDPINFTDVQNLPSLNTTQDRANRLRLRARVAIDANISPAVKAGFRIATGDDNSPISTNSRLAGGLTKRDLWLDRAFVELTPNDWITADFGRFADPFRSTQLLFDEDLNFDGIAVNVKADRFLPHGFGLSVRGGAFPLDNGSANFPSTSSTKASYPSKWLFSGQIEGSYQTESGIKLVAAAAYHDFHQVQGQLSTLCLFNGTSPTSQLDGADPVECSTDGTRAISPVKGNTLFKVRQIGVPGTDAFPAAERQYLGLSYKFRVLDLNASVAVPLDDKISAVFTGNYLRNLAFHRADACRNGSAGQPFTNVVANTKGADPVFDACATVNPATIATGGMGWLVNVQVGHPSPRHWGEWNVSAGYRYLQSDAVLDSFTDSDFHLGGTNAKGYTISVNTGLFDGITLGARWLSANEIVGEPLSIDVLQIDLSASF